MSNKMTPDVGYVHPDLNTADVADLVPDLSDVNLLSQDPDTITKPTPTNTDVTVTALGAPFKLWATATDAATLANIFPSSPFAFKVVSVSVLGNVEGGAGTLSIYNGTDSFASFSGTVDDSIQTTPIVTDTDGTFAVDDDMKMSVAMGTNTQIDVVVECIRV